MDSFFSSLILFLQQKKGILQEKTHFRGEVEDDDDDQIWKSEKEF